MLANGGQSGIFAGSVKLFVRIDAFSGICTFSMFLYFFVYFVNFRSNLVRGGVT
jgi:hypothetical protein